MSAISIEIDCESGFCFGVVTAIRKAEEELAKGSRLYCLGDIVHNSAEVEAKGLRLSPTAALKSSEERRCYSAPMANRRRPTE